MRMYARRLLFLSIEIMISKGLRTIKYSFWKIQYIPGGEFLSEKEISVSNISNIAY